MERVKVGGLNVAKTLHDFVRDEALPGKGIAADAFWSGLAAIVRDLAPRNRELLATRDRLQEKIDAYLVARKGSPTMRRGIKPSCARSATCGPNPPISRSRRRMSTTRSPASPGRSSSCRCRTPAMRSTPQTPAGAASTTRSTAPTPSPTRAVRRAAPATTRNAARRVVARARALPRRGRAARAGQPRRRDRLCGRRHALAVTLRDTAKTRRSRGRSSSSAIAARPTRPAPCCCATTACMSRSSSTANSPIGTDDPAGVADVVLESAITTIMDLEDSVAAVDADDKVAVYRNWLGLMNGTLAERFEKGGTPDRAPPQRRTASTPRRTAASSRLPGRSLMLVRNVGHHMYTDAVLDADGQRDARRHPRRRGHRADRAARPARRRARSATAARARSISSSRRCTARTRSRSPTTCSRASRTCSALPRNTLKMGIMDEERRTTRQPQGLHPARRRDRVVFINTGFLDRTGDEIHTSMRSRPDGAQERHARRPPGSRPTRTGTSMSGSPADSPARRRSARACGRRPTGWPTCWRRRSAIRRPAPTPPGCRRPPPRRCMRCTIIEVDVAARQKELAIARRARSSPTS